MAGRVGIEAPVAFADGAAKNGGVVQALEEAIGERLIVPDQPETASVLEAALIARDAA